MKPITKKLHVPVLLLFLFSSVVVLIEGLRSKTDICESCAMQERPLPNSEQSPMAVYYLDQQTFFDSYDESWYGKMPLQTPESGTSYGNYPKISWDSAMPFVDIPLAWVRTTSFESNQLLDVVETTTKPDTSLQMAGMDYGELVPSQNYGSHNDKSYAEKESYHGNTLLEASLFPFQIRSPFMRSFMYLMAFFLIATFSYLLMTKIMGRFYGEQLESEFKSLENEVLRLSNALEVENDAPMAIREKSFKTTITGGGKKRKRILTYTRNELLPLPIEEIAYIYTEGGVTHVISEDERRSTVNLSLDEVFLSLDNSQFFRANRQVIIAITAIDKIIKYGNNRLKINMDPKSEVDIIISKNRAAAFKHWLNL